MNFTFEHMNINVINLEKSIDFYEKALGLEISRRIKFEEDGFELVYLKSKNSSFELELTYLKEHPAPYELGENETHLALSVGNIDEALKRHKEMDCVVFENTSMGIYFIADPDGHWIEIVPTRN